MSTFFSGLLLGLLLGVLSMMVRDALLERRARPTAQAGQRAPLYLVQTVTAPPVRRSGR